MKPDHRFNAAESAEEQASLWVARLRSGRLDSAQRAELQVWLADDPSHRVWLENYCETCAGLDAALVVLKKEGLIRSPQISSRRLPRWLPALAAVGVAAVLAFVVWPAPRQSFITPRGQRQTITLADTSSADLNANTIAVVTMGRNERRVKLERGEALFKVAKDPSRPFYVTTPHGVVRVTGTVFNVRVDASAGEEVTVLEGTVQVAARENVEPVALHRGDQSLLNGQTIAVHELSAEALRRVTAWREGRMIFERLSLREALERVAGYHGRKIEVSPELDGLSLGGQYDLDDMDVFLKDIEQVLPVRVLRGPSGDLRIVPR